MPTELQQSNIPIGLKTSQITPSPEKSAPELSALLESIHYASMVDNLH